MKASLLFKFFFIFPFILFVDYLLIAFLGCASCIFSPEAGFYCGPFCLAGKIILALSVIFFGYLIYPNIREIYKSVKNGPTA